MARLMASALEMACFRQNLDSSESWSSGISMIVRISYHDDDSTSSFVIFADIGGAEFRPVPTVSAV